MLRIKFCSIYLGKKAALNTFQNLEKKIGAYLRVKWLFKPSKYFVYSLNYYFIIIVQDDIIWLQYNYYDFNKLLSYRKNTFLFSLLHLELSQLFPVINGKFVNYRFYCKKSPCDKNQVWWQPRFCKTYLSSESLVSVLVDDQNFGWFLKTIYYKLLQWPKLKLWKLS